MGTARFVWFTMALLPGLALAGCGGTPDRPLAGVKSADIRCPGTMIQLCTGDSDSRIDNEIHDEQRFCICQAAF